MADRAWPPPIPGVTARDRVLVVGAYGARNVGDEAILAGLLASLPSHEQAIVVSKDPRRTRRMHGVTAIPPRVALNRLRHVDAVVVGGGGLFSSHVGPAARLIPAFGLFARAAGRRVVIHGVGVDRSTPAATRAGLVRLARAAEAVTVRDRASAALLAEWGVRDVAVAPDLSTWGEASPPEQADALLTIAGIDPRRPIAGLALNAIEPGGDSFLRDQIPALIESLPDVQFCFVPMSHHPGVRRHNDLAVADFLRRRVPALKVLRAVEHPEDVIAMFERFSAAVCMRYHSLLFARRAGVPIVALPYAPKCSAWLAEEGIPPVQASAGALQYAVRAAISGRRLEYA